MTMPSHDDLSTDARAYIQSLHESPDRQAAAEYAHMDSQSFQGRIGPAVDTIAADIAAIRKDLKTARHLPVSRKLLAGFAVLGGGFADVLLQGVGSVIHHISTGGPR